MEVSRDCVETGAAPGLNELGSADRIVAGEFKAEWWARRGTGDSCGDIPSLIRSVVFASIETVDECDAEVDIAWPEYDHPELINKLGEADTTLGKIGCSVP